MWLIIFSIAAIIGFLIIVLSMHAISLKIIGIILMLPMILSFVVWFPDEKLTMYEEYNIYALNDNITISGSGGLFFHYIDSDLNYHVRVDYKDGKKTIELNGNKVFLVETLGQAKVEIYINRRVNNLWLWNEWGGTIDIKIFVPIGTLKDNYNSDME